MQVNKHFMQMVLDHYTNKVSEKFQFSPPSPATFARAEAFLSQYQQLKISQETHPAWGLALKLIADQRTACYAVTLDEQAIVELV